MNENVISFEFAGPKDLTDAAVAWVCSVAHQTKIWRLRYAYFTKPGTRYPLCVALHVSFSPACLPRCAGTVSLRFNRRYGNRLDRLGGLRRDCQGDPSPD